MTTGLSSEQFADAMGLLEAPAPPPYSDCLAQYRTDAQGLTPRCLRSDGHPNSHVGFYAGRAVFWDVVDGKIVDRIDASASVETIAEKLFAERRKLERGLAFEHACSVIETNCAPLGDGTFDLANVDNDAGDSVKECAEYLEWRGLLLRKLGTPDHVTVLDESEANDLLPMT